MSLSERTKTWLRRHGPSPLTGKTVLVTGAAGGVGFKTAEIAVYLGAKVLLACRDPEQAAASREALLKEYPDATVRAMPFDPADLWSVETFAAMLQEQQIDLHAVVNCVDELERPNAETADGFDYVIGTNYFGVYALSEQLLPYLATLPHKVLYVNTVSPLVRVMRSIDYGDFYSTTHPDCLSVYGRAKLCLAKYTYALAKRYEGTNVRVQMVRPGVCVTLLGLVTLGALAKLLTPLAALLPTAVEKAALSIAYLFSHDLPAGSLIRSGSLGIGGYPKQTRVPRVVRKGGKKLLKFTRRELKKKRWGLSDEAAGEDGLHLP